MGPLNPVNQAGSYIDKWFTYADDRRRKRPFNTCDLNLGPTHNYFGDLEQPGSSAMA